MDSNTTPELPGSNEPKSSPNQNEPGLSPSENLLLTTTLPHSLDPVAAAKTWDQYQSVIAKFLVRMGTESKILDSLARVALVRTFGGLYARLALIPKFGYSALNVLERHSLGELAYRMGGELSLMELSAAAGYRTFCLPDLIKGLLKSGKMRGQPISRMLDTFEFLNTMFQFPMNDPRVDAQLERTNGLHTRYKVAGSGNKAADNLFKYIALNMFYIGPAMRPDLSPQERHAICGLTVLVSKRMGHTIVGSVKELEAFISEYEATQMFDRSDPGVLRRRAVEIAQASKAALSEIPTISPARIHGYVPYRVRQILELD